MAILEVWGGAGEHGRACYRIANGPVSVMLDCGGKRSGRGEYPLWKPELVPQLTTVFLSHAHEDHTVGLPALYRMGYRGEIWTTRATATRIASNFRMWKGYLAEQGSAAPYSAEEEELLRFRYLEDSAEEGEWFEAAPGVRACWGPSGHLAGSVWILLDIEGCRVFYSGDYTHESSLLRAELPKPEYCRNLSAAIVDAAYGARTESQAEMMAQLIGTIRQVSERGGHVFLPVPLHGRGLELLALLREALPDTRIVAEASLLQGAAKIKEDEAWLHPSAIERMNLALRGLQTSPFNEAPSGLAMSGAPAVIIGPDAQLQTEGAQACYRQLNRGENAVSNAIIFTGHVHSGSCASKIIARHEADPEHGHCSVYRIPYKVHQGLPDVWRMLEHLNPRVLLPVHTDKEKTDRLVSELASRGYSGAHSLTPGQTLILTAEAEYEREYR
ncbi:MBL fold metallo-hydrolase [Paenibacillus tarimensis]|uniref:MBL fold metallo-hydrolase n=1 Tax=Paenibacillus tarimensis TaxID=416012 RepID=UPI001F2F460F|nr:MBL fold metallo-hydrolase [Paenibacillus tarimensis]MCF2944568.1 MBL fold metallo-hydrolase [Paenibacillus tarimensis]